MRTVLGVLVVIGAVVGGGAYYAMRMSADPPPNFRTATVTRGNLLSSISATGTVEAEEFVDVGAQVNGPIKEFGVDPTELANYVAKFKKEQNREPTEAEIKAAEKGMKRIDFGSEVNEGSVLALIDDAAYKADLVQAEATLQRAKADLIQLQAKREQAAADWERAKRLRPDRFAALTKAAAQGGTASTSTSTSAGRAAEDDKASLEYRAMSDSDFDLAKANNDVAQANVVVGEKTVKQAEAARDKAQTYFSYTIIKSPVKGTIIARRMNVGQTVVASFNAASLFLIAKDLRRVEVWASVNEADIGRIHPGQHVRFTVDAFPGETFEGAVEQIRLNAQMTQNVVTYTVVVQTDNSNLRLLPYLTANLQFEVEKRENVLLVPNAALRWKPRSEQIAPEARAAASSEARGKGSGPRSKGGGGAGKGSGKPAAAGDAKPQPVKERTEHSRLWVQDGNFVRPIEVQVGMSDGSQTEVSGSELQEGIEVVTGELRKDEIADSDTTNPFAPKLFRHGQKKSP